MASSKLKIATRLAGTDKNPWVEFGKLAVETKAVNLGQGFPDFFPPSYVTDGLLAVAQNKENHTVHQYARSYGHTRLVTALASTYGQVMNRSLDPMSEVLITVGAYGALFCTVQGLINPGDEAIIIEPFFDCYQPMVTTAGGIPVYVPMRPSGDGTRSSDWKLDPDELASKFNSKTKAIFVNNPNNPLGKVFTLEELTMIADLAKKHDVLVIADEVYEWMIYQPNKHIRIATLPGMWERTLTIGSAGKTFSVTGWKVGWAMGPPSLIHALQIAHQNCIYTCPAPTQEAVAAAFETEMTRFGQKDCYLQGLSQELLPKRLFLEKVLSEVGMKPVVPDGGYFMVADISQLEFPYDSSSSDARDSQFVKWMCRNKKLAAIPTSVFYSDGNKHLAENHIRFCFCKDEQTLQKASEILKEWNGEILKQK